MGLGFSFTSRLAWGTVVSAIDDGCVGRFVELDLEETGKIWDETIPHPDGYVLGRWVVEQPIEVVVVDLAEHLLADDVLDLDEVDSEPGRRVHWPFDSDDESVVVSVGMKAGTFVIGKSVRGVELELDAKDQRAPRWADDVCSRMLLRLRMYNPCPETSASSRRR
jgi:hypothetical protein